jgi:acyl-CoA thioester hydrolase
MIEYSAHTELRIDWSDLDALGHVNHLAIMRYIQTARVLYFELLGMSSRTKGLHVGPIMASVSAQFKKQILYPGMIRVLSTIQELKTTSLHMKHYVIDDDDEIAAEGHDVIVMFDFLSNEKHIITEELRKKIEDIEAKRIAFVKRI